MPTKKSVAKAGKAPAKKTSADKAPAGKATAAKGRRTKLSPSLCELLDLLPELDEAGLAFLLEQAKVHRYNMEVERLNAISKPAAADNSSHAPRDGERAAGALRIERSTDGSTYHIVAGNDWKMFTAEEMAALVRITRAGEGAEETARRLRAWFARERKDVFLDFGLDGPSIGMTRDIAALILKTFPPRSI